MQKWTTYSVSVDLGLPGLREEMRRGEIYRVHHPSDDPKLYRCFVILSRQTLIDSKFRTVVCAPILTRGHGFSTQVSVGIDEGLKHESWILCDNLLSLRKAQLTVQRCSTISTHRQPPHLHRKTPQPAPE
jgi:mRNA interferase MazF